MSLVGLEHLTLSTGHGTEVASTPEKACFGSGRPSMNRGKTVAPILLKIVASWVSFRAKSRFPKLLKTLKVKLNLKEALDRVAVRVKQAL